MTNILFVVHLITAMLLAAYGCHRLTLALRVLRAGRQSPTTRTSGRCDLPSVTVQIPLYNERYVASRAITAAARLDYPLSLLEIQVLDDSTDETTDIVRKLVHELRLLGVNVRHERRATRDGYKAGALAHGLERSCGDLIAVLDADFVPSADFLKQLVHEFEDPTVGMVQARWGHLNRNGSLLTKIQALQLDAHFMIEHAVRADKGCFFNFNGTAGIWRKRAITSSGGWRADTLTEDLDLSYRAQLAGWRFVYRNDVVVPAELPVEIAAYRIQQQRWAQGSTQTAMALLSSVFRAPVRFAVKWEAFWHLTGHVPYFLLILLAVAGAGVGLLNGPDYRSWLTTLDAGFIAVATMSLSTFYLVAARERHTAGWGRAAFLIFPIMVLGAGIAFGQALAVGRGVLGSPAAFRRTPKYHQEKPGDRTWRTAAYRIPNLRPALAEWTLGTSILALVLLSTVTEVSYPSGPLFVIGLGLASTGLAAFLQHPNLAKETLRRPRTSLSPRSRGPAREMLASIFSPSQTE